MFFLFRHKQPAFAGGAHGSHEQVIANNVKLFLVVAGRVGRAGKTGEIDQGGSSNVVGDGFEGELQGMTKEAAT